MRILLLFLLAAISHAIVPLDQANIPQKIAFGSCNKADRPQIFWDKIAEYTPDLFVWLGDIIYADHSIFLGWRRPGDVADVRRNYALQLRNEAYRTFLEQVPVVGVWDDHDLGANDGDRHYVHKRESQQLLLDFLHVPTDDARRFREGAYVDYLFGHGNDTTLQLILLDNRYFRDPYCGNKGIFMSSIAYTLKRFVREFSRTLTAITKSGFTTITLDQTILPFKRLFWDVAFSCKLTFSSASNVMRHLFGQPLPRTSAVEFTDVEMASFDGFYDRVVELFKAGETIPIVPATVEDNELSIHFHRKVIKHQYKTFIDKANAHENQHETSVSREEFFQPSFFELDIPLRCWTNSQDMLGKEQWEWLGKTLLTNSGVTVLGAGLQIIGSGSPLISESWSRHLQSRAKLLSLLAAQKIKILWSHDIFTATELKEKRQDKADNERGDDLGISVPNLGAYVLITGDVHHGDIHALQEPNIFGIPSLVEITSSGLTHSWAPPLLSRMALTAIMSTTRFHNTIPYFQKNWGALEFIWSKNETAAELGVSVDGATEQAAVPSRAGPPDRLSLDIFGPDETDKAYRSHVISLDPMNPMPLMSNKRLLDAVFACAHSGVEDGITIACEYVLHNAPPMHSDATWRRYLRNHTVLAVLALLMLALLFVIPVCITIIILSCFDHLFASGRKFQRKCDQKTGNQECGKGGLANLYMHVFRPLLACVIFIALLYASHSFLRSI